MSDSIISAINVTENGIVSKKLMSGNGGNISLFAFDAGQSIDKHSTPSKALVMAIEGEATFQKGSETINLKKDDYLLLEENEEHSLEAKTSFKMLLVIIKP